MHISESRKNGWYVVQVQSGTEIKMCQIIESACHQYDRSAKDSEAIHLKECFTPRFITQKKWKGSWKEVEHMLLPGYIIASTGNPGGLSRVLRRIGEFSRLITNGESYEPLSEEEKAWMESCTSLGNRVIPMSFACKVGDELTITQGPLKGMQGLISKVDRKNSLAHLDIHVGSMRIKTTVGLGVLPGERTHW